MMVTPKVNLFCPEAHSLALLIFLNRVLMFTKDQCLADLMITCMTIHIHVT